MKKALAILLAALTASSLLMTGCGEKDEGKKDDEKKFRVVMICSALGDKSYYDIAYEGLKKAETDLGVEIKVAEIGTDKAKTMVEPIVADANPSINGVDKSMSDPTVYVTAKTAEGGDVQYKVSLVRDMIGWKVSNVELYFPSQN